MKPKEKYITFDKNDPQLQKVLLYGELASGHRCHPVSTLSGEWGGEHVTLEVFSSGKEPKVSFGGVVQRLLRPEWLGLSLGPALITVAYLWAIAAPIQWGLTVLAFFLIFLLHVTISLKNDVSDFLSGADHRDYSSSRNPIARGWVKAANVMRISNITLGAAVLLGLGLLGWGPNSALLLVGTGVLGLLVAFSKVGINLKAVGLGELTLFLLSGPLLVLGFSFWMSGFWDLSLIALSVFTGHGAVIVFQARQLQNITNDSWVGNQTFAVRLGFDSARVFLYCQLFIHFGLLAGVLFLLFRDSVVVWVLFALYASFGVRIFVNRLFKIASPFSSLFQKFSTQLAWVFTGVYAMISSLLATGW